MESSQATPKPADGIWLSLDTCGALGSVALGRWRQGNLEVLAHTELDGRNLSSTLVGSIAEILNRAGVKKPDGIVVVRGPGSFTGVRVGLAVVKGLAEAWAVPVVVATGLELMADKAGVNSAAMDAHRQEIFLRVPNLESGSEAPEMLAGDEELTAMEARPALIAVCDDKATDLLAACWPGVEQLRVEPPNAVDALQFCGKRIAMGDHADLALLDGHYLRRSDAEIFGRPTVKQPV
jgi:tRNA threonylcarbamoyladenosine biosynthesis protein TsaB